ncbi:hypothetical protein [Bifidobacterium sp. SO1]|uniref:hypothetical protein n=1 Tax=Bifidobacterium sp. SO1 TaxID=2809029 RepID=UPI001BDC46D9|nr:hypothetical protein [Bifidobacterium sp. SO1]MBT1161223.1 hypothetical protein [Bifidobacterium sp. SO1]
MTSHDERDYQLDNGHVSSSMQTMGASSDESMRRLAADILRDVANYLAPSSEDMPTSDNLIIKGRIPG